MGQWVEKWAKNRIFLDLLKILIINFYWIWSKKKIYIIIVFLHNTIFRKNLVSEIWAKMVPVKKLIETFSGWAWSRHDHSGHGTLKLTLSQVWTDGIVIFCMLVKVQKAKSYFNDFWVSLVKKWHSVLLHETLKSDVS